MRRPLILTALLFAAACAPTTPRPAGPRQPLAPAAPPIIAAPPPPRLDWRDWPVTAGGWRYARDRAGTRAVFSPGGVTLACGSDRQVRLRIDGRASLAPLTVRTSTVARQLTAVATDDPPGGIAAALAKTDPLLDAMAFSRGRFAIEQAGAPPLVLPSWAEVGRVIEDCRG